MRAGRKNKYVTHVKSRLDDIEQWCKDGLIEAEICKRLGVGHSQFNVYKNDYPELSDTLKRSKQQADYEVNNSLFKRAMGYEYEERTMINGIVNKIVTKYMAPDVTACIFWLKNRMPDRWKDSKYINQMNEYKDGITINLRRITGLEETEPEK